MSVWASTFVPLWFHFGIKNGPKSTKRVTKTTIEISIDFSIDLGTILAPFWDPFWTPLGHFGPQSGACFLAFFPHIRTKHPKSRPMPFQGSQNDLKKWQNDVKKWPSCPKMPIPGRPKTHQKPSKRYPKTVAPKSQSKTSGGGGDRRRRCRYTPK